MTAASSAPRSIATTPPTMCGPTPPIVSAANLAVLERRGLKR
jgi:hypothetical protein